MAISYHRAATARSGGVADLAESRKKLKYDHSSIIFSHPFGSEALSFISDLR